ncbi:hypothetical protein C8R44DRAFT_890794 [Mycena epipterygia]|nr:hypothetical protein C8R44DRAFT_890794 [Mycena epipterygia]
MTRCSIHWSCIARQLTGALILLVSPTPRFRRDKLFRYWLPIQPPVVLFLLRYSAAPRSTRRCLGISQLPHCSNGDDFVLMRSPSFGPFINAAFYAVIRLVLAPVHVPFHALLLPLLRPERILRKVSCPFDARERLRSFHRGARLLHDRTAATSRGASAIPSPLAAFHTNAVEAHQHMACAGPGVHNEVTQALPVDDVHSPRGCRNGRRSRCGSAGWRRADGCNTTRFVLAPIVAVDALLDQCSGDCLPTFSLHHTPLSPRPLVCVGNIKSASYKKGAQ